MTGTEFAALIRLYTNTNSTTLTNGNIVTLAQAVKDHILAPKISGTKEGQFEIPAYRDLVASATSREYDLPDDILDAISRVEVKFDSSSDYIKIGEISQAQYPESEQESIIVSNFSNLESNSGELSAAKYDKRRGAIFIYSGTISATVANGLKVFYNAFPQPIAANDLSGTSDLSVPATSTSVSVPRLFHEIWARGVSRMWKQTRDKPIALSELEQVFDRDLEEKVSEYRNSNDDLSLTADLPDDSRLQDI